jgi:hypothetical protein
MEKIDEAVIQLNNRRLPTTVLAPSHLAKSLQMLLNKRPGGLVPVLQTRELAQYYVLPLTTVHMERNSLTAKVTVPLTRTGTSNRLYLLQPFPFYAKGKARLWRRPAGHVAVNTQKQYWMALPPQFDPDTECWGKEPIICPQSYPEMEFPADSCIDDLFHQAEPRDPTCAPADQQSHSRPRAVRWKDTYWALAIQQSTELRTACGKGTTMPQRKRLNITGSVILHLPEHCTALLAGMQLKAANRWSEQVQGEIMGTDASQWDPRLFTFLTMPTNNTNPVPDFDVSQELKALGSEDTSIAHIQATLRRYLNETEQLANQPLTYGVPTHHAVMSLWTLVVILAVLYIIWNCRRRICRCRTPAPSTATPEAIPLPPIRNRRMPSDAPTRSNPPNREPALPILE